MYYRNNRIETYCKRIHFVTYICIHIYPRLVSRKYVLIMVCAFLLYAWMFCFQMLIGFSSGQIVLWDLKTKSADYRCQTDDSLTSITWHHEGKQFMCSHSDGSLSTWTLRQLKPSISFPHGETSLIQLFISVV